MKRTTVGLEVGTAWLRSVRVGDQDRLEGRACRAAYAVLPSTASQKSQKSLLLQGRVPFAVCGDSLVLLGEAALEHAELFHARPLSACVRSTGELESLRRQVLALLLEAVLPQSKQKPEPTCCLACSAVDPVSAEFVQRVVKLAGYKPLVTDTAQALALAELSNEQFSGVVLLAEGRRTEAVVFHQTNEVARVGLSRGTFWLWKRLAENADQHRRALSETAESLESPRWVQWFKQQGSVLGDPRSEFEATLTLLVSELLDALIQQLRPQLKVLEGRSPERQALTFVCAGELAELPGFRSLFKVRLRQHNVPAGTVKSVGSPYAVARGCLIQAFLSSEPLAHTVQPTQTGQAGAA